MNHLTFLYIYISVTATANLGTSSATDLDDTDMSLPSMTPLVANSWHDSVYNSENDMQDQFTILDDQDSSPSRVRATPFATTMVAQSFVESAQTEESDLVNILMNCRLGEGVINYLKQFVQGNNSSKKQDDLRTLCKTMIDMIGNQLYDYNTCTWIAQKLEIDRPWRLHNRLITLTENDFAERRGRPPLDITLSSAIYLEWISSSVVSTDSHNSRGEVHISQAGYNNSSVHQCGIKLFEEIK